MVRTADQCEQLIQLLELTPYERAEFELAFTDTNNPIERARRTVIRAQMGFGSAGATKATTGFRSDTKRQNGTTLHKFTNYPENLLTICRRLKGVLIENKPWQHVVNGHDGNDTLFFIDPPYLHATRQLGHNSGYYRFEMTDIDHLELLKSVNKIAGMAVISGYPSEMYSDMLTGWHCKSKFAAASGNRGTKQTLEMLWLNPACVEALEVHSFTKESLWFPIIN